jgi:hypothetical protein
VDGFDQDEAERERDEGGVVSSDAARAPCKHDVYTGRILKGEKRGKLAQFLGGAVAEPESRQGRLNICFWREALRRMQEGAPALNPTSYLPATAL